MKYAKEIGPQTTTEGLAILFALLSDAYNRLAQYEADEMEQEKRARDERLRNLLVDKQREDAKRRATNPFPRSEAAHREDDAQ